MENGVEVLKMGATGNINTARLATLQERKKTIEETLLKRTQELRELCRKEAELTGIIPTEMPLEPGEALPLIRRRVGTAYQLPENLLNNNKDEIIADLELQIQLHFNLAEAALGLAKEHNISKTVRRQHRGEYENHKKKFMALQERLALLKEKSTTEQQKQKKKSRVPEQDESIVVNTNITDVPIKSEIRHSLRSNKHSISSEHDLEQQKYSNEIRHSAGLSETSHLENQFVRNEDMGFFRLSINGFNNYMELHENSNVYPPAQPYMTDTFQNSQKSSPHFHSQQTVVMCHPQNLHVSQHSSFSSSHSPNSSTTERQMPQQYNYQTPPQAQIHNYQQNHFNHPESNKYNNVNVIGNINTQFYRRCVPTPSNSNINKTQYYSLQTVRAPPSYRQLSNMENQFKNPHQIPPHQQYEQNDMVSGLGGFWKRSESGEVVWFNSNSIDSSLQRDKRFGSLDRRKNKRIHNRGSPSIDNKSATLGMIPNYPEHIRIASVKSQIINRRSQDNRQLVRTQSLGSVGAQTVESIYLSDDNSSFGSEDRNINEINGIKKQKEKEWLETSLDGPVSPTHSTVSCPHSVTPLILAPEEKYHPSHRPSLTGKPLLEIPAESNQTLRLPEKNVELFNPVIPKNCTVVQAGRCKPYHEETKPFEMSDFYKYSTKYKKSPVKGENSFKSTQNNDCSSEQDLLNSCNSSHKSSSQSVSPYSNQPHIYSKNKMSVGNMENSHSPNANYDINQIGMGKNFSPEMNTWYHNRERQIDNNTNPTNSKSRSTATLV